MPDQSSSPGPAAPEPPPSLEELKRIIDQTEKQLADLHTAQTGSRSAFLLTSLVIIASFVVFGALSYQAVRTNVESDMFRTALKEQVELKWPKLQQNLVDGFYDAIPTYRQRAIERWDYVRPQLEKKAKELEAAVPKRIEERLTKEASASFGRVARQVEADVKRIYPGLTDKKLEQLGQRITEDLAVEGEKLADELKTMGEKELQKYHQTLDKFPVRERAESVERVDLERQLVHHLLMLADYEVSVAGTKDGLEMFQNRKSK